MRAAPAPRRRTRRCRGAPASATGSPGSAARHRPGAWQRDQAKPDGGEEGGHLILVLLGEQRAGSVDQTAAGANQGRGLVEDRRLLRKQLSEIAPRSGAAARRDCAARCRCRCRARPPARDRMLPARRLAHLSPGSIRWRSTLCTPARRRRRTAPSSRAADTSQATSCAAVLHRHRQRQRLAAGAGALDRRRACPAGRRPARRRVGCPRPGSRPGRRGRPARW